MANLTKSLTVRKILAVRKIEKPRFEVMPISTTTDSLPEASALLRECKTLSATIHATLAEVDRSLEEEVVRYG